MATRFHRSNDEIRTLILKYLYDRNASATSARGKRGAACKIGDLKRDLKQAHGLSREEVWSNLRYLISQTWVEEQAHERVVPTGNGRHIPSVTPYFAITAAGIDKIEGPSDYTPRDRFAGISINAGSQSTVFVGDGNQVSVQHKEQGEALALLANAIKHSPELSVHEMKDAIVDVDTIQAQLARSVPNSTVIRTAWAALEPLSRIVSLASAIVAVGTKLAPYLG